MAGYPGLKPLWTGFRWLTTNAPTEFNAWCHGEKQWLEIASLDVTRRDIYGRDPPGHAASDNFILDVAGTVGHVTINPPDRAPFRLAIAVAHKGRAPAIVASSVCGTATPTQVISLHTMFREARSAELGFVPGLFLDDHDVVTVKLVAGYASANSLKDPPTMTVGPGVATITGLIVNILSFEQPH